MKGFRCLRSITERCGLPLESIQGVSMVELSGDDRLLIEFHKNILCCSNNEIVIGTNYGDVHILGENLSLREVSRERIIIF